MSSETWRVVTEDGSEREVRVRAGHSMTEGLAFFASIDAGAAVLGTTPRLAVLRLCAQRGIDAEQILAPGEPTRAEAIETARRDGAEAMREACASRFEVRASGFDDAAREWGRRSEPNLVADCERQARAARIEAATIRALPLPGEVTS